MPFCQVPLQDPDAACAELDRALAAGHVGVEIGNHVGDRDLDDAGIVTFLQHAAAQGVPGVRAPVGHARRPASGPVDGPVAGRDAGRDASLAAGDGARWRVRPRPAEPADLLRTRGRLFAFWLGRLENAWRRRPDVVPGNSTRPPSEYVGRFSVDTVVFAPPALRLLVDTLGADNVMVGSDYPYPFGERPVGDVVRRTGLPREQERRLLSANAEQYLTGSA